MKPTARHAWLAAEDGRGQRRLAGLVVVARCRRRFPLASYAYRTPTDKRVLLPRCECGSQANGGCSCEACDASRDKRNHRSNHLPAVLKALFGKQIPSKHDVHRISQRGITKGIGFSVRDCLPCEVRGAKPSNQAHRYRNDHRDCKDSLVRLGQGSPHGAGGIPTWRARSSIHRPG